MAGDRADTGDPRSDALRASGALDPPGPQAEGRTLAARLAPAVDRARAIAARLGFRPHRVFLVHGLWSGGRRGEGQLLVTSRREVLPAPRVRDMSAVRQVVRATGRVEEGDVYVDEVSVTYAEADLMGETDDLRDPSIPRASRATSEFWWEVQEQRPGCPTPGIRTFAPASAPDLKRDEVMWAISLTKKDVDPGRAGDPGNAREVR
jgi:hypothetical protein